MPKISVVVPSYNHALYIDHAINSVLNQTESDLELIVVDDGSTDDSIQIIKGFQDQRLILIKQSNQGAHAAINRGLRESSGKFISILNSDDVYYKERIGKLVNVLEANPEIGLIGTYIEVIDAEGEHLGVKQGYKSLEPWLLAFPERSFRVGNDLHEALLTENYYATTSNFLFRRKLFDTVGEFRPLRFTHDWDFALRIARIANLSLFSKPLLKYRVHPKNTIREDKAAMIFEICWILAVHLHGYLRDEIRSSTVPYDKRINQLLHSIYTYECDRVLNVLLAQNLFEDYKLALDLLKQENPVRMRCLEYIQSILNSDREQQESPVDVNNFVEEKKILTFKKLLKSIFDRGKEK